jgi:hypothetical protein
VEVYSPIGIADVACGGDASDACGVGTTIHFASCSAQFHDYFDDAAGSDDPLVRTLTGKRPPSGSQWSVGFGGADGLIQGQPPAHLKSD